MDKDIENNTDDFIIRALQSCNINFLIGAGASIPAIEGLGNFEEEIKETDKNTRSEKLFDFIKPIIEINYDVCEKYTKELENEPNKIESTNEAYELFIKSITDILIRRRNDTVLPVTNIFTTNYDLFLEHACETLSNSLNYNDGFRNKNSMFSNIDFNLSEFYKVVSYKSDAYSSNISIPNINVLKMHGSVNWKIEDGSIFYNNSYDENLKEIDTKDINFTRFSPMVADSQNGDSSEKSKYIENLGIILPTEDKFRHTVLNRTYYGILRHFAMELEKHNTILIAIGVSFNDKHINDILFNALKVNPTLQLFINIYNKKNKKELKHFKDIFKGYENVRYITDKRDKLDLKMFCEKKLSLRKQNE